MYLKLRKKINNKDMFQPITGRWVVFGKTLVSFVYIKE